MQKQILMLNFKEKLSLVKAFAFDVDGVFTDSSITLLPSGEQVCTMNVRDGYAVQLALQAGYQIAIISGGSNETVRMRFVRMGIQNIFMPTFDKVSAFVEFVQTYNLNPQHVLYMGDDIPDYYAMQLAGIKTCPADADSEIKQISDYVSLYGGGKGCVRDVIEQTLRAQNKWTVKQN